MGERTLDREEPAWDAWALGGDNSTMACSSLRLEAHVCRACACGRRCRRTPHHTGSVSDHDQGCAYGVSLGEQTV